MSYRLVSHKFRTSVVVLLCFFVFQTNGQDAVLLNTNKELITKYIDVVINGHNISRKSEFFHEDYIWHKMDGESVSSRTDSGHTSILRWLFTAIPDVHYRIENIEAGGNMVGITTTATGIARSEMFGLPVGQKKVTYKQMFFYLLKNGKIAEQWEVVDADGIKSQLEKK